nr:phage major capsid protein [Rummeliibacillus sp. TYF-LIM-RU47]
MLKLQFFGNQTLFELKQAMATIGQQLQKTEGELTSLASNTSSSLEDIQNMQKSKADLQARFNVIKEQHDAMEAEQKASLAEKQARSNTGLGGIEDPQQKVVAAKASLIRATMKNKSVAQDVRAVLGDGNNTGGEKFLPKTVSQDVILAPLVKNPLREIETVTQITNLELPRLAFTLDDDDFIADTETAKEMKLKGDNVVFGRHKFKVLAGVSETVLNGTDTALVTHTENALRSGLAAKEKKVSFAKTPKAGEEHMSFYSDETNIARVQGTNTYKAIKSALTSLHEDYRENATIVMAYSDYSDLIETLANGNATLYTAQPEQILGKPVVFVDAAAGAPIVGDFNYAQFNYDLGTLFENQKDVKLGIEYFVVTAWFDHQIKLSSAFRIAEVTPAP